jgi:hypothetical protein
LRVRHNTVEPRATIDRAAEPMLEPKLPTCSRTRAACDKHPIGKRVFAHARSANLC